MCLSFKNETIVQQKKGAHKPCSLASFNWLLAVRPARLSIDFQSVIEFSMEQFCLEQSLDLWRLTDTYYTEKGWQYLWLLPWVRVDNVNILVINTRSKP